MRKLTFTSLIIIVLISSYSFASADCVGPYYANAKVITASPAVKDDSDRSGINIQSQVCKVTLMGSSIREPANYFISGHVSSTSQPNLVITFYALDNFGDSGGSCTSLIDGSGRFDCKINVWDRSKVLKITYIIQKVSSGDCSNAPSDDDIRLSIIRESINAYPDSCPCPYSLNTDGDRCGETSIYSRMGGYEPICYQEDVTDQMIQNYKFSHGLCY
jgi:hypothetical protein